MARNHLRRLSTGLPTLALTLSVLFLSTCGGSQPGVTSTSEVQAAQTTVSTSVPSTAAPTTAAPTTAPPTTTPVRDENWSLQLTVDVAEPDTYSFGGTGDLLFHIDGDKARVTGVVTIGDSTFEELVFDGVLRDGQFILLTMEFSVEAISGDDVDTEDITLDLPPFALEGDTVRATGNVLIVNNAVNITESGTFTIILSRSTD